METLTSITLIGTSSNYLRRNKMSQALRIDVAGTPLKLLTNGKSTIKLSTFSAESIPVAGQMTVDIRYASQGGAHQLYIVKRSEPS